MKYVVTVMKTVTYFADIEVEADSPENARDLAVDEATTLDEWEYNDYDVKTIQTVRTE